MPVRDPALRRGQRIAGTLVLFAGAGLCAAAPWALGRWALAWLFWPMAIVLAALLAWTWRETRAT